jgi:hypothetical protein
MLKKKLIMFWYSCACKEGHSGTENFAVLFHYIICMICVCSMLNVKKVHISVVFLFCFVVCLDVLCTLQGK